MPHYSILKLITLTGFALVAFAANSVLSRLALQDQQIDASGFTIVRMLSGAITLLILLNLARKKNSAVQTKGSWSASLLLFIYAISFSYAYLSLDTGTGALILFGSVQMTIILVSIYSGTRLHFTEWLGVSVAFYGFTYLILPNISTPSTTGFFLMSISGIAWGMYTLQGKDSQNPLSDTTYNFLRTLPFVLLLIIFTINNAYYSIYGITLAILSGSLASGIGYSIWYAALAHLTSTQAAVLQLLVPIIAALGGVYFASEAITLRLSIAGALVLGGILIVILGKKYFSQRK